MSEVENQAAPQPAAPKAHTKRRRKARRGAVARKRAASVTEEAGERRSEKAPLIPLDPLEAAQEAQRHAQEGNQKLAKAVEALRATLETIVVAEQDLKTGLPVTAKELRQLAVRGLDAYSAICGQSWRRAKLTGATRAGDKSLDAGAIAESLREV